MSDSPKNTLRDYAAEEISSIVSVRCQELSEQLTWLVTPPKVRVVEPDELQDIMKEDARVRTEKIRGKSRSEGLLAGLASWLLGFMGPAALGYFGTSEETLFLNGELVPQQGAYVLLHELVHAAQWQHFPGLYATIDEARVAAEDLADQQGDDAPEALAARDRYESLVTFLEGHATHHGRRACEQRLLKGIPGASEAEVKAHVEALMGLDPEDETIALIYRRGEETLARMEPMEAEAMFEEPERIVLLFSRLKTA